MVPEVGLEPTRLSAGDFESPVSTISPPGPQLKQQKRIIGKPFTSVNDFLHKKYIL